MKHRRLMVLAVALAVVGQHAASAELLPDTKPDNLPARNCVEVSVDDLYGNYSVYDGSFVCTKGEVYADLGGVYLLPTDSSLTLGNEQIIRLGISYAKFFSLGLKSGQSLLVEGLFSYDVQCFEGTGSDDTEIVCAPYGFPMLIKPLHRLDQFRAQ